MMAYPLARHPRMEIIEDEKETATRENIYRFRQGGKQTETARCIKARYNVGYANHKADNSGVLEIYEDDKIDKHR